MVVVVVVVVVVVDVVVDVVELGAVVGGAAGVAEPGSRGASCVELAASGSGLSKLMS